MMVVLTICEDGETVINDWLVNEKLALRGKLVRIFYRNFSYLNYLKCYITASDSDTNNVVSLSEAQYNKNQSISADKAHRLSNVKNVDFEMENLDSLRNVPVGKRSLYQMLVQSHRSQNIAESQSDSEKNKPNTLKSTVLQRLKSLDAAFSLKARTSRTSSQVNGSFKGNLQQINSDIKADVESQNTGENYNGFKIEFGLRDSDDEETTKKDFGEFHSLFGGQGSKEPIDWSVIEDEQIPSKPFRKSNAAICDNDLDTLIEECENDTEAKSESRDDKTVSRANKYFVNFTGKGEEYYSPEMNIEYNDRTIYLAALANLRNKMLLHNDKCTQVIVPQHILETLRHGEHSPDASECSANTVKANGSALPSEKMAIQVAANKNGEVCETKADRKVEKNESFDTDLKSASCNMTDNGDDKIFESDANDFSDFSMTREKVNLKFKAELLRRMKEFDMNLSKSSTTKSSSSSEQIPSSSCSTVHNSSTDDIISSTDNEQSKILREKRLERRINMLRNFTRPAQSKPPNRFLNMLKTNDDSNNNNLSFLKNGTSNALRNDSTLSQSNYSSDETAENEYAILSDDTTQQLSSQSFDSIVSSTANVAELKQHQLNRSLETDSNVFVDKSKSCQLNATTATSRFLRFLQTLNKTAIVASSDTDLDSDDLSYKENSESNKSCDTESKKSADESMYGEESDQSSDTANKSADESMHLEISELPEENALERFQSPSDIYCFNDVDCDDDSNDEFEAYGNPEEFLQYFMKQN